MLIFSAALGLRLREMQVYPADWAQAFITGLLPFSIAVRIMTALSAFAEPAEYISEGSAVRPAGGIPLWHRLAFYNIGWDSKSRKPVHTKEGLAKEICDMVQQVTLDAVGISEVYNLKDDGKHDERQVISRHLVSSLNSSAARPASSAWASRSDGHYIFVWNSNKLVLKDYEFVSCGIKEHSWRKAQYLQFQCADSLATPPLHVIHNHSPSSSICVLTNDRRKRVFSNLWDHVLQKSKVAQPAAIFGGDFNCSSLQWVDCFKHAMGTQASRRSVQVCFSKADPISNGDRAIALNVFAAQEPSGWGKSFVRANKPLPFSDAHDVVLVPICWSALRALGSDIQPASSNPLELPSVSPTQGVPPEGLASGNTAQPTSSNPLVVPSVSHTQGVPTDALADSSAAKPALSTSSAFAVDSDFDAAPSLILPSPETPLYNALLEKLSTTGDENVMESLADFCVFDKLKFKKPYGSAEQPADKTDDPYLLGLRIEHLLAVTNEQRSKHLARLASRYDGRAKLPHALFFNSDDMREIMNEWRNQPETWMHEESLQIVKDIENAQAYHQAIKIRFSTMLFQLFGNKSFVELFIRFPICSVEQPASLLKSFPEAWHSFRNTPEATRARENSQRNETGEARLSKQIYVLEKRQKRAQWVANWVAEDWNNWYQLCHADQTLWAKHNSGTIRRQIADLRARQQPNFPGAAECLAARAHFGEHI